jgi:cation:H+ antiporter
VLVAAQVIAALLILFLASDAFTNAVEWIGALRGLTRSAVGAVVAAIGSSLPDTVVTLIAIVFLRDAASHSIGIGAVIGAPLMLTTLVLALAGIIALVKFRNTDRLIDLPLQAVKFGLVLFSATFALVLGASFAASKPLHYAVAILALGAYAAYLAYHFRQKLVEAEEQPPPLRLYPRASRPALWLVAVQLGLALLVTVQASRWFIAALGKASLSVGLPPFLVSVILTPIATELPEAMNVVIWMRRGLSELSISNVLGAMMFQTSIASSIAMFFTPWKLDAYAYAGGGGALAAALLVLISIKIKGRLDARVLALCGVFYVAYLVYVLGAAVARAAT